jgi:CheY-like chemotaxis protein/HPt (histidine-containing phosphotransfer) domain-containing protein
MALDPQPFSVERMLRNLFVLLAADVDEGKPVALRFDVDPALPDVLVGDDLRLQQVLVNLGGNALKFTPQGEVVVSMAVLHRDADSVTIGFAVRDTGIGIAPENQARIFSGFTQAESSTTRRFGGTGLGVSISQRLVALMGGELKLDSVLGRGSRFHFSITLPVADTVVAPMAAELPSGGSGTASARRLEGWHLLLVEDNPNNRQVARELLESEGARVRVAHNGQEAIDAVRACDVAFDLVLMDLQMPVMDGLTATRGIRALPGSAALPIVAMTANALASDRESCLEAGMNDHVGKPFDLDHLVEVLHRHAGRPASPVSRARSAPDATLEPATLEAARVAGIDLCAALMRLGGRRDVYVRLLRSFARDLAPLPAQLLSDAASGDARDLAHQLHSLKGVAATVGATDLSTLASGAERQLKDDAGSAALLDIATLMATAVKTAQPLFTGLLHTMQADAATQSGAGDQQVASPIAPLDVAAARAAMHAMAALLRNADMAAMAAMESLKRDFGVALAVPLAPIDEAMGELDFERALDLCNEAAAGLGERA